MSLARQGAEAGTDIGRRSLKADGGSSSLPIYHQLTTILRQQIKDSAFAPEQPLPSEMQLAAAYDVSRVTVRRALDLLEREGWIRRKHGVGTFVAPRADEAQREESRVSGLVENLITLGLETTARLLAYEPEAPTPAAVLQALGLPADERALRIERLRFFKDKPLSVTTVWLPRSVASLAPRSVIDDRPIMRILEGGGIRAQRAEQTISAIPADDAAANKLNVAIGAPLLRLRRTVFDGDGRPFEHQVGLYNPDQYEYHMLLTRDNSSARPQWRHIG
jgi:GntR family transcriptional regulator